MASSTKIVNWNAAENAAWEQLLLSERAHDVEACAKSLMCLCFLLASRDKERKGNEQKHRIKQQSFEKTTLQTIERLLRKHGANLRLVPCRRRETQSDQLVFRYPGVARAMSNCVYLCIEGERSAMAHVRANGWRNLREAEEALADCGFVVYASATSSIVDARKQAKKRASFAPQDESTTLLETLQSLDEHVQLTHDSSLLPKKVPRSWLPAHCCTCRRVASLPIKLYKLPCQGCDSMYCCSAPCWAEHLKQVHKQDVAVRTSAGRPEQRTATTAQTRTKSERGENGATEREEEEEAEEEDDGDDSSFHEMDDEDEDDDNDEEEVFENEHEKKDAQEDKEGVEEE